MSLWVDQNIFLLFFLWIIKLFFSLMVFCWQSRRKEMFYCLHLFSEKAFEKACVFDFFLSKIFCTHVRNIVEKENESINGTASIRCWSSWICIWSNWVHQKTSSYFTSCCLGRTINIVFVWQICLFFDRFLQLLSSHRLLKKVMSTIDAFIVVPMLADMVSPLVSSHFFSRWLLQDWTSIFRESRISKHVKLSSSANWLHQVSFFCINL